MATSESATAPSSEPTRDQLGTAVNRAADEVIEITPENEHLRDVVNLVVNAALHYMEHPHDDLRQAIEANYSEDFAAELIASLP